MAIPEDVPPVTPEREAALKVLRKQSRNVKAAPHGERNDVLNKAAFTCGGLIAAGWLERVEVEDDLLSAIIENGGDGTKDAAKIGQGIEAGMRKPWTPEVRTSSGRAHAGGGGSTPPPEGRHREDAEGCESFERGDHAELSIAMLAKLQGDGPELVQDDGALHRYDTASGLWRVVTDAEQSIVVQAFAGVEVGTNKKRLKVNASDVAGTIKLAGHRAQRPGFFAEGPRGIGFTDGFAIVTANGVELRPLSPEFRCRHGYDFAFTGAARPKRCLQFFDEVWRDDDDRAQKIALVQEFGGLALIGAGPRFQRCIVALGKTVAVAGQKNGQNGKSQLGEILSGMMPECWCTRVPPQLFENEYRRAKLAGKRLNVVGELPEADIIASESFKAIIAGDPIEGRHIFHDPFDFRPQASHYFSCNTLPGTNDLTFAFFRRFILVTFNRMFVEGTKEHVVDIGLKIVAEERREIVCWMLDGAVRALAQGHYTIPQSHEHELREWQRTANQVALFLEEQTVPSKDERPHEGKPHDWTKASRIYEGYRVWANTTGHKLLASNKFGSRMAQAGCAAHHNSKGNFYPVCLLADRRGEERMESPVWPPS